MRVMRAQHAGNIGDNGYGLVAEVLLNGLIIGHTALLPNKNQTRCRDACPVGSGSAGHTGRSGLVHNHWVYGQVSKSHIKMHGGWL